MDEAAQKELYGQMTQEINEKRFLENRLLSGEVQLKIMSGYYAVFAAMTAILSIVRPDKNFYSLSVAMTVLLALWVIAMCVQKNADRAQRLRSEAAALMRLMQEAQRADGSGQADSVYSRYLDVLTGGEGISAHEKRALQHICDREEKQAARKEGKNECLQKLFGYEKFLYWFAEISMIVIKTLVVLAPIAGITLTAVGLL